MAWDIYDSIRKQAGIDDMCDSRFSKLLDKPVLDATTIDGRSFLDCHKSGNKTKKFLELHEIKGVLNWLRIYKTKMSITQECDVIITSYFDVL